ncbi:MAG: efflux RND transporter periplasmic adaptor subunit [Candidatus Latescibacteria bacterium]|nr:efflux RND transporter periplasmic adaptor subunit [Candidatus Latescibacterota bacterium]
MRKVVLPLLILALGVGAFYGLKAMRQPPPLEDSVYLGPLVQVVQVPAQTVRVTVEGQGTVRPDAQIDLIPQVSGLVVWKAEQFEPGGTFAAGDLLFHIDPRDYELAVDQAEALVAQARYRLDLARQESAVARQEWERLRGTDEAPSALVLRLPQLNAARADSQSARARLEEALLRLGRTKLYAPFDGRVRTAAVEPGQHVSAGQRVAQIYSVEKAEIVVPVPDEDLAWFALPYPMPVRQADKDRIQAVQPEQAPLPFLFAEEGAAARINGTFAGRVHQWDGRIVRTEGELDPRSRMARLVVEVDDPYGGLAAGIPPLTVGMFVDVAITGRQVEQVRRLPRAALRPGDKVWVAGPDGVLYVRRADVVRRMRDVVLVHLQMERGEGVVVSQLNGVTDGMKVRLALNDGEAGS